MQERLLWVLVISLLLTLALAAGPFNQRKVGRFVPLGNGEVLALDTTTGKACVVFPQQASKEVPYCGDVK